MAVGQGKLHSSMLSGAMRTECQFLLILSESSLYPNDMLEEANPSVLTLLACCKCHEADFFLALQLHKTSEGDLVIHKDVQEGRKRGGQLTLGTPLKIQLSSGGGMNNQLTFEDLDEIIARYVEPMCERFQEVIKHR